MSVVTSIRPARDRYIPIVRQHVPTCQGKELELRCSLLMVRDQSASALRRCSEEAYGVLAEVHRLSSENAFAAMPLAELAELRRQLVQLTACASGLEMFAYRLACPKAAGGTDARG